MSHARFVSGGGVKLDDQFRQAIAESFGACLHCQRNRVVERIRQWLRDARKRVCAGSSCNVLGALSGCLLCCSLDCRQGVHNGFAAGNALCEHSEFADNFRCIIKERRWLLPRSN